MSVLSSTFMKRAAWPVLLCLAVVSGGFASASSTPPGWLCAKPVDVSGQGRSCPAPGGGWQVIFDDGTTGLTHGPDLVGPLGIHGAGAFLKLKPVKPSCVTDPTTQFHTELLYARPTDQTDHLASMLNKLRDMVYRVNAMLDHESSRFGVHMKYRMTCSRGDVSVVRANLDITKAQVNYASVVSSVRRAGFTNPVAKYWVWVDGPLPGQPQVGGEAIRVPDENLSQDNQNNFGPMYGVFYGFVGAFGAEVIMHEGAHSLGAVQDGAPNSSGAGHCYDDSDVMCYPDHPGAAAFFKLNVCREIHFDCNNNDYFNPRPQRGNYLYDHWNLASPLNRFLAGCHYSTGVLTAPVPGERAASVDTYPYMSKTDAVSPACAGHPFALTGVTVPPSLPGQAPLGAQGVYAGDQLNKPLAKAPANVDVCFFKASKSLRCFTTDGADLGTIPSGTTKAVITVTKGAKVTYVLSAI